MSLRVAVLTVSDAGARGERADTSGDAIVSWVGARGHTLADRALVADEVADISARIRGWADDDRADLILTTGGTGFSPRDVTPEATRSVIEREAPGLAEAMRAASLDEQMDEVLESSVLKAQLAERKKKLGISQ